MGRRLSTQLSAGFVNGDFIWPIRDPETVNERRKAAGFTQTIEEYAADLFGEDFQYKVLTLEDVQQEEQ